MPEFSVRNEFACSEDTFWNDFQFNEAFNKKLYLDALHFAGWEVLEQKEEGSKIIRRVRVTPPIEGFPAPVRKIVGDKFSYVEEGMFDRTTHRYTFKTIPSTNAEKTKIEGELWTEKTPDGKTVRHAKMTIQVKVFMIGGMVEEKILGDVKRSYEQTAQLIEKSLRERQG